MDARAQDLRPSSAQTPVGRDMEYAVYGAKERRKKKGHAWTAMLLGLVAFFIAVSLVLASTHVDVRSPLKRHPVTGATLSAGGAPASLQGPTIPFNFPDPAILSFAGATYAFGTNTPTTDSLIHVQVATSTDNLTWSLHGTHDALPDPGPWALSPGIWAPDVIELPDSTFILYYSAQAKNKAGTHCIGAAVSPPSNPLGPYYPLPEPLACPIDAGGAIDADGFLDPSSGKRYLAYKIDGNNIGHGGSCRNGVPPLVDTPILLQEVSTRDGVTPLGRPTELLHRTDDDGPLIEAPSLYRTSWGVYFLFYSSGCFAADTYDVKYATATDIKGPWTRATAPLLSSGVKVGRGSDAVGLVGPGGMDVLMPSLPIHARKPRASPNEASRTTGYEETIALFHGILSESQLPDGYDFRDSTVAGGEGDGGGWREPDGGEAQQRPGQGPASRWNLPVFIANVQQHLFRRGRGMPVRPHGVVRGMFQGRIRFEGKSAFFV